MTMNQSTSTVLDKPITLSSIDQAETMAYNLLAPRQHGYAVLGRINGELALVYTEQFAGKLKDAFPDVTSGEIVGAWTWKNGECSRITNPDGFDSG